MNVTDSLQNHHKLCDEDFAGAEEAAQKGDWAACGAAYAKFRGALLAHFDTEENCLFPAFEEQTGMTGGPTQVMRQEHTQMRGLIEQLDAAFEAKNGDGFGGTAETLLVLMQQHNMKEENILYPMCDQALGGSPDLTARIEAGLAA